METMTTPDVAAWIRLGRMLKQRRLGLGHHNIRAFAGTSGISRRLVYDIEDTRANRRTNFRPSTLGAIEHAYQLDPGTIAKALHGGDLAPSGRESMSRHDYDHPHDQAIWNLTEIPEATRLRLIALAQEDREIISNQEGQSGQSRRRTG